MAGPENMADGDSTAVKRPALDVESLQNKKFKTEELPISAAQRAAIDNLLFSFKKKGGFDNIRKTIWAEFNDGEAKKNFTDSLIELAESEIEREPALLSRERGKAATLIEGAVDRSDIYKNVESAIYALTQNHLDSILSSIREIRRQEVGEEIATQEERSGNKTDEDFARLVKEKRDERERIRQEELRKQKELEEEKAKIKAEEQRRQREIQRRKEEEEAAKEKEREEQRRAERERLREERRRLDEEREKEREERYERRRREEQDRYRDRDRGRDRDRSRVYDRGVDRSPRQRDSRKTPSPTPKQKTPPPVDEKSLEEAALQMLLKEGEELAAKSRQKPEFDFEEAEAIENGLKPAPRQKSVTESRFSNPPTGPRERSASHHPERPRDRKSSRSRSRIRRPSGYDEDRRRETRDRSRATSIRTTEPTETAAAQEAGPQLEIGTERGTGTGTGIGTEREIAAVTEIETEIDIVTTEHETVSTLVTEEIDRDGGEATIHDPARDPEDAHVLAPGRVQLVADLLPVDDPALAGIHLVNSTSTAMCPRRATGVDLRADESGPRTEMIGRDLWKLIVTFLVVLL
ncbi:hypothetical protein PVAR5_3716 [Paecilomyces variotii No. 5]|uniref:BOD1/SHG1 domain-containing protein n=1 Tax=Byssochlamys spectabilis (strain No. 5 / NBRC 109023) TaxID=1356009 RepID=V5FSR4_BYSSN|nr:hypothetical protein PVAR5_3716 [Paecilomyces variotii No. 5]